MTSNRPFSKVLDTWLDDGPEMAPPGLLEDVLSDVASRPPHRRGLRAAWRHPMFATTFQRGAAIAAVLAIALIGVWVVGLRSPQVGGGPTAIPTSSPGASVAPSVAIPGASPLANSTVLVAGSTYSTAGFSPGFSILGEDGWQVQLADAKQVLIWPPTTVTHGTFMVLRPGAVLNVGGAAASPPADLVAWIQGRTDLSMIAPTSVTVDGKPATMFEGSIKAGAKTNSGGAINLACEAGPATCRFEAGDGLGFFVGDQFRLVVATVDGTQLLILMSASAADWQAVRPQMEAILASMHFAGG